MNEPFTVEWRYRILPPPGFVPKELPKDARFHVGPALLTEEFSAEKDGVVVAHLTFDTVKRRYTVAEANGVAQQSGGVCIAGPAIMINFEPQGEVLLHEGKVRRGAGQLIAA